MGDPKETTAIPIRHKQKEGATKQPTRADRKPTLEEFVQRITPENRHGEIDWGEPVGNEY